MRFQTPCVPFLIFAFIVFANNTLSAQFRNELMLQTGDTSPVNGDVILGVGVSGINDHGEVLAVTSFSSINIGLMIADGQSLIQLVRTGDDTPSGDGQYSSFSTGLLNGGPFFNNQGTASILSSVVNGTSARGLFSLSPGEGYELVRLGQLAPDGDGTFSSFSRGFINNSNQLAFSAELTGNSKPFADSGVFRGQHLGSGLTTIARGGDALPDGNGIFRGDFSAVSINDWGQVAFIGDIQSSTATNKGIYVGSGSALTKIVRKGEDLDGNGVVSEFNQPLFINDNGRVAFEAEFTGSNGGNSDFQGIYLGDGINIEKVARLGDTVPDGDGTFTSIRLDAFNNNDQVAYAGFIGNTSSGANSEGAYRYDGNGQSTKIARKGEIAPGTNVAFSNVDNIGINDAGMTAYSARISNGSRSGIWASDGIDSFIVALEGDTFNGLAITEARTRREALNQHGQIAYSLRLSDGSQQICRWTPDLNWRTEQDGSWDNHLNWTLSLYPALVHNTNINPLADVRVTGPSNNTTVRSLNVGRNTGHVEFALEGHSVTALTEMIFGLNSTVSGDGALVSNLVEIQGDISPGESTGHILFDGDVDFFTSTSFMLEIDSETNFDQMMVTQELSLSGDLQVSLLNNFELGSNQEYVFLTVGQGLTGNFNGLGEGDLVGAYGGRQLFISYTLGNGNDVGVFTIPEPSSLGLLLLALAPSCLRRTRIS